MTSKSRDYFFTTTVFEVPAYNSGVPDEVIDDIRKLWENLELGNDYYYVRWSEYNFKDHDAETDEQYRYPALVAWLREHEIESCLIHYWW